MTNTPEGFPPKDSSDAIVDPQGQDRLPDADQTPDADNIVEEVRDRVGPAVVSAPLFGLDDGSSSQPSASLPGYSSIGAARARRYRMWWGD